MNLKPEVRYLSALLLGMIVTSGLFFLMQALIDSGEQGFDSSSEGQMMEFIRIKDDESLSFKDRRKPVKPKPPKEPPPPPKSGSFIKEIILESLELMPVKVIELTLICLDLPLLLLNS